jgi:hypothetical protein
MSNETTVAATAIGGAASIIVTFIVGQFGVDVPGEVGGAVAVIFSSVVGALTD